MVLAYVPVYGWIVHPNINCFFNGSSDVLVLPPHNAEIFSVGFMTCDVIMVIYWGGGHEVFFESLLQMFLMTPQYTHHHILPCCT